MEKALVVLGAGATYDSWGGLGVDEPALRPPLTADLFGPFTASETRSDRTDRDRSERFENILLQYPGAHAIAQDLAPFIARGAASLEERLEHYAHHSAPETRRRYLEVPAYLRHIIMETTERYTHSPGPHVRLIQRLLQDLPHEVIFVSLNYDTILESLLRTLGIRLSSLDDYVTGRVKVVKPHGSVDWAIPLGTDERSGFDGDHKRNWFKSLDAVNLDDLRSRNIRFVETRERNAWEWTQHEMGHTTYLYPAITAPLSRKDVTQAVCPPEHLEALKSALPGCTKVLIIGCSGLDDDLLSLLTSLRKVELFTLVDRPKESGKLPELWDRFASKVPALAGAAAIDVHEDGFRDFTEKSGLDHFAESKVAPTVARFNALYQKARGMPPWEYAKRWAEPTAS